MSNPTPLFEYGTDKSSKGAPSGLFKFYCFFKDLTLGIEIFTQTCKYIFIEYNFFFFIYSGSNTNILPYQRVLIVLQNVHIIHKRMDILLDELLQYGLYNLRYKQIYHLQNQEKLILINKLGICFDIIIDFTCCTSEKQIVSVYNRLPGKL